MSSINQKYEAVLVSSNEDIVITMSPFCEDCFCEKRSTDILKHWIINEEEVRKYAALNVSRIRVSCTCEKKSITHT